MSFAHDLSDALDDRDLKPGEDALALAKSVNLEIPDALRGVTVQVSTNDGDPIGPVVQVTLPPTAVERAKISIKKCFDFSKEGPLGVGKVTVRVCVQCTATYGQVKCTITATIVATI